MDMEMKNKIIMGLTLSLFMFSAAVTQAAVETEETKAQITALKAKLKGKRAWLLTVLRFITYFSIFLLFINPKSSGNQCISC